METIEAKKDGAILGGQRRTGPNFREGSGHVKVSEQFRKWPYGIGVFSAQKWQDLVRVLILIFTILCSSHSLAKKVDFKIELHSGNESERKAEALIRGFGKTYDLSPYIFTKDIFIQSMIIPHSHPVLTLNTRQISEPERYLALLIHEEIHWFFAAGEREAQLVKFISRMREKYPRVPSRKNGGAIDDESTYLHFGVCYYELEAMKKYIGEKKAIENFGTEDVYSWIRKEILNNKEFVKETLLNSGLQWKDAGQ